MFIAMASQKIDTDGQDCCNKITCTPKTHISINILAKSAKGNYLPYRKKLMYDLIWDGKLDKIKREILTSEYDKGGLRMIDIEKFIWSLKISWVKRILQTESNSLLKHLYENVLNNLVTSFNFNAISEKLTLLNISIKKNFS